MNIQYPSLAKVYSTAESIKSSRLQREVNQLKLKELQRAQEFNDAYGNALKDNAFNPEAAYSSIQNKYPVRATEGLQDYKEKKVKQFSTEKEVTDFLHKQATLATTLYDQVLNESGDKKKALGMVNIFYHQVKSVLDQHTNINVGAKDKDGNPVFPDMLDEKAVERLRAFATGEGLPESKKGKELTVAQVRENREIDAAREILKDRSVENVRKLIARYTEVGIPKNPNEAVSWAMKKALRRKYGADPEHKRVLDKFSGNKEEEESIAPPPDGFERLD